MQVLTRCSVCLDFVGRWRFLSIFLFHTACDGTWPDMCSIRDLDGCCRCCDSMQTGASGHVHIDEYIVGMSVDVFFLCVCVCVCVWLSAFMHIMWLFAVSALQTSCRCLTFTELWERPGCPLLSAHLTHSIRGHKYFIWRQLHDRLSAGRVASN